MTTLSTIALALTFGAGLLSLLGIVLLAFTAKALEKMEDTE